MIYQKDVIDASKLKKIASKDACLRLVKKMLTDGEIMRHKDKNLHNAVYFSETDAEKVQAALTIEAERRLTSLNPAPPEEPEPQPPAPAAASEEDEELKQPHGHKLSVTPPDGLEVEEPAPEGGAEPKTIKQLAIAPGPKKRTPSKKAKNSAVDPDTPNLQEKIKGLSKSVWLYVGAGALLLLAFGWWRAHRKIEQDIDAHLEHFEPDKPTPTEQTGPPVVSDKVMLERWNNNFKDI